jgi:hypothetical protein
MRKPILKKLIASAPGAKPVYLDATGWLEGKSAAEIKLIYRDYKAKLKSQTAELARSLGKPTRTLPTDRCWFDAWYPESLAAAAWDCGDKMICLAVEHHDRETPVALLLRCLTRKEIDDLAA